MKSRSMINAAYLTALLGVLLHLYLTVANPAGGSAYFNIVPVMNIIPYIICIFLARSMKKPIMPLSAAIMVLLLDLFLFNEYLFATKSYRFLLVEIYQIMLKTAVILPLGCFIGYLIDRFVQRGGEKQA
ncbi:MAG TPA: hypothetical protein VMJ66_14395 [Geobacteraceae bacterium]|nr:hypothetical protein [Geobacteraceae bacterium]